MKLGNGIAESDFLKRFPLTYKVRALTPWQAAKRGVDHAIQHWEFLSDFVFVSDKFGAITVPTGFVTDFASIPRAARSLIDDDSPTILYGSAPHDKLFSYPFNDAGRELSLNEVNSVLTEAMYWCGASRIERALVYSAVSTGGALIWRKLRKED